MRRARGLLLVLVVFVLVLAPAAPVFAVTKVPDGNDARGILDISHATRYGKGPLSFRITMFESFTARQTWDRGFLFVFIDSFGDRKPDYFAYVASEGDRFKARLKRYYPRRHVSRTVAKLTLWRPDHRSVTVKVPVPKLHFPSTRDVYRWYAQTMFGSGKCKRALCFDWAPNLRIGPVIERVPDA